MTDDFDMADVCELDSLEMVPSFLIMLSNLRNRIVEIIDSQKMYDASHLSIN